MAKLRRTLLIGLGGTGFKAILNAKKMFYDNYGEIPPMIGFLGIDTDAPGMANEKVFAKDGSEITLNNSEQVAITVDEPREVYDRNAASNLFDWVPEKNVSNLTVLDKGAGQIRSNGRFAITNNERKVETAINQKINAINDARIIDNPNYELLGAETEVHMAFSIGGGTGSGTFLNVAYLVKRLFPKVKLSGYAVLPDIFRVVDPGSKTAMVRPNGKGALIDLDFLAHLGIDSDPVDVKWYHQTNQVRERPFTALYLIDNKNDNNDMFTDIKTICQMIALAMVTSVGELGVTLASIADNVDHQIADGVMDVKNKKAWVASFGCAEIIFDGDRLAKIYANKAALQIINMMLNGGCDDPANIANAWFDNTHIRENHGHDDVIDYFMPAKPRYTFTEVDNPDNPEPDAMRFIQTVGVEKQSDMDQKLEELRTRVDESLNRLMIQQANRECGIFLCNSILHNILTQIRLCDGEMETEIKELEESKPLLESSLKSACAELKRCMGTWLKIGKDGYIEEVTAKTMALATREREIHRRKMARTFYGWLLERVGQSIQRVDIIMQNLEAARATFSDNIQKALREGADSCFFQFDLASEYADKITCQLADIVFNNFVADMKQDGGINAISGMTSQQTEEAIMRYVNTMPKVESYKQMTVDDHLNILPEDELRRLVERAIHKSLPLLSYSYRGFDAVPLALPEESYFVGVANDQTSRLNKNNLFGSLVKDAHSVKFSNVGFNNRIIIYRQLGVLPTFAIKSLDNYRVEYDEVESKKPFGTHWDKNLCMRMKKERYDLMPKDDVDKTKLFDTWVKAIVFDLISYDPATGKYRIKSRGMGGHPLRGWLVDMGANRSEAFAYLEDNSDVLTPEINQAIKDLDVPGPDNVIQLKSQAAYNACVDNTYLETISKSPITLSQIEHYPAEMDLIGKEMTYIINNFSH